MRAHIHSARHFAWCDKPTKPGRCPSRAGRCSRGNKTPLELSDTDPGSLPVPIEEMATRSQLSRCGLPAAHKFSEHTPLCGKCTTASWRPAIAGVAYPCNERAFVVSTRVVSRRAAEPSVCNRIQPFLDSFAIRKVRERSLAPATEKHQNTLQQGRDGDFA